jgi:DNA repair protein RecN (Recombination protein N)
MYEGDASVYDELVRANELLSELSEIDESVNPYQEECSSAAVTVKEIGNFLNHYSGNVDSDPGQLNQIEERIVALRKLMKKFGPSLDDVIAYQQKLELMLDEFESFDSEINRLTEKKQKIAEQLSSACQILHKSREQAAEQFSRLTEDILHRLGMEQAQFHAGVVYQESETSDISVDGTPVDVDVNGADQVEFYIITNPGEGEKPLAQIASGGEISRTMLAIKSVLAGKDGISTVIFDEIDIGISGRISRIVGEELRSLSKYHQVICITHLPQIASLGDIHYVVGKEMQDDRTATRIRELDHEERIREIATLVGGETISETTLNNARELLRKAQA